MSESGDDHDDEYRVDGEDDDVAPSRKRRASSGVADGEKKPR
jgi:hypothetical protein